MNIKEVSTKEIFYTNEEIESMCGVRDHKLENIIITIQDDKVGFNFIFKKIA